MTTSYLFDPAPVVAVPIAGQDQFYPVHRIFCVGRNYAAHAEEMGSVADKAEPFYFTKHPAALVPSGTGIAYPAGTSNYHYEIELVVAIGTAGFEIAPHAAVSHVFGYACGLDMTRRDLQIKAREKQRPWDLAKDFEESAVLSPLVPAETCGHVQAGRITLSVNGTVKQDADLQDMVNTVPELIAHLSKFYHLVPGDLIYTGTPAGVGPVHAGDEITGSIATVGTISLTLLGP